MSTTFNHEALVREIREFTDRIAATVSTDLSHRYGYVFAAHLAAKAWLDATEHCEHVNEFTRCNVVTRDTARCVPCHDAHDHTDNRCEWCGTSDDTWPYYVSSGVVVVGWVCRDCFKNLRQPDDPDMPKPRNIK